MSPAPIRSAVALVTGAVVLVLTAGVSAAQTATSQAPSSVSTDNPNSFAAGVVFFVITGAIAVGALVLYLRNRRPRPTP